MALSKTAWPMLKILLPCLGIILCVEKGWAEDWVPVQQEPQHRLVFENDRARILDVNLPPGYVSLYHRHVMDLLYVTISGSKAWAEPLGGQKREVEVKTGDLRFSSDNHGLPHIHRVANIGDSPFRMIAVGLKAATESGKAAPAVTGDLRKLNLALEKSHAGVYRIQLKPGEKTGIHRHNLPVTQIYLNSGQLIDEEGEIIQVEPGQFQWQVGGFSHRYQNAGDKTIDIIEVQWR